VYRSKARDLTEQDDFLNAIAHFESEEPAETIRAHMKSIEEQLHKNIEVRFGPRTIDLDLLLYDDLIMKKDNLIIPHPRMHERRFVLEPLLELIDPQARHPILNASWKNLLTKTLDQHCEKIPIVL
jgi:2-amino-4-hydroxy-6-hydroxymethyldihydropteridine diphosphokinase